MTRRQAFTNYLYFVPIFLFIAVINLFPLISALRLSFWNENLLRPADTAFAGLTNFVRLLTQEPLFWGSLGNGLVFTAASVVLEYALGLASALVLSSRFAKLRNASKALIMLPWAIPIAMNSMIWHFLLSPNFGFINQLLSALGFTDLLAKNWLGDINAAMGVVVFVNVWRSFPFFMITLAAGLSSIPKELYEAAEVDGARRFQRFWSVTLPGIRGTSVVIIVFHLIWTFTNFDVIYLLTGGGPLNTTEVLPTLMYRNAFLNFDMGYASAIGVFQFVVLMIVVGPLYKKATD
jgi:multiple sugar transport system permease protein